MAAASTVSAAPNNSLPALGAAAVGSEDLFRCLRHDQNQRQLPPSSLRQLLLVKNHDVRSPDHCIPAGGGEDSVTMPFLGQSDPVVEQENSAISEQSCFTRDLGNPTRPAGAKNGGGGGKGSTSSDGSEECSTSSGGSSGGSKPHQGNDGRWKAIRAVISRDGELGLGHFILQKKLGCGDIGTVYLAELSGTSCNFAMKIMNKDALESRKKLPRAQTEREILERLDHPFLPTLYSYFQTEQHTCLLMEYCPGGDLHTLRQRRPGKCFSEQAARFYVAEVLLALEYLHMLGIVYRDLKPENVLVREDGHIMLSDFDLSLCCTFSPTLIKTSNLDSDHLKSSAVYCAQTSCIKPSSCMQPSCFAPRFFVTGRSKKDAKAGKLRRADISFRSIPELSAEPTSARSMSFVGTHEYLAPEIIKGEGHGSAVDWWTFGIFLYELLFGKTPFKGPENRATLFNVVGEPLRFPEAPPISFAAKDLIKGLLVKDPQQRLAYKRGATEIKQHPFFQSVNWALIRCASPPEMPKLYRSGSRQQAAAVSAGAAGTEMKSAFKCEDIEFF